MNKEEIYAYCYELGWKGESNFKLLPDMAMEIQQILISRENFTYSELDNLDAETVDLIYTVISAYNTGEKRKQEEQKSTT